MGIFKIVADCENCRSGKVPYDPPNVTKCSNCGLEVLCHKSGEMEPIDTIK